MVASICWSIGDGMEGAVPSPSVLSDFAVVCTSPQPLVSILLDYLARIQQ